MYQLMGEFKIEKVAIRYSQFVPQLYNYCLSLGFERKKMMPSQAFCSDETQGYPAILLAQHFGTFPFDHGQVGGRVATDRNGPHAHHGEDLVIVQASYVGYDPSSRCFGIYQRQRTEQQEFGANCGKLNQVLNWYQTTYRNASCAIQVGNFEGTAAISIDNALLNPSRSEGLFLHLDRMLKAPNIAPLRILSTSKVFQAGSILLSCLPANLWFGPMHPIGTWLSADLFHFQREPVVGPEGLDLLERAVAPAMPSLVTSQNPVRGSGRLGCKQTPFAQTEPRPVLPQPLKFLCRTSPAGWSVTTPTCAISFLFGFIADERNSTSCSKHSCSRGRRPRFKISS